MYVCILHVCMFLVTNLVNNELQITVDVFGNVFQRQLCFLFN